MHAFLRWWWCCHRRLVTDGPNKMVCPSRSSPQREICRRRRRRRALRRRPLLRHLRPVRGDGECIMYTGQIAAGALGLCRRRPPPVRPGGLGGGASLLFLVPNPSGAQLFAALHCPWRCRRSDHILLRNACATTPTRHWPWPVHETSRGRTMLSLSSIDHPISGGPPPSIIIRDHVTAPLNSRCV